MSGEPKPFNDALASIKKRSDQIDEVVGKLAASSSDLAVLAVGGYGRQELCFHSDVDLLFVHEGKAPEEAIRSILYPLWDERHKVGHATRTVRATLAFVRDDLAALCSLLSARLICGPEELWAELETGLAKMLSGVRANLPELLAAEERQVWEREPYPLQELNLKSGRGALRSHQRLEWDRRRSRLIGEQPVVDLEPRESEAVETLLAVRQALHAVQRRSGDLYPVELRPQVGEWLERDPTELASKVYGSARTIDAIAGRRWGRVRPAGSDPIQHAGLAVIRLIRSRWSTREPAATPFAYARAAAASGSGGRLSGWESDFASRAETPTWQPGDRSSLLALLAGGGGGWEALVGLWESGWLIQALPELAHLRGLAQVAPFHRHPVDAHLGATVANVISLAEGAIDWCGEIAEEMGAIDEVLLAAFLHDIGKGLPGDHSETGSQLAQKLLSRIGFSARTTGLVSNAVRHHLLLPEIAFRQDVEDPAVVAGLAKSVGSIGFLHLLTLLSVADARATGPDMWSPWKESLIRVLVTKTAALLAGSNPKASQEMIDEVQALTPDLGPNLIHAHLEGMPAAYLDRFGPELVASHLRLAHPPLAATEVRTTVVAGAPVSNLVVAARDRPGLLATVAGALALHNLNVLEARVVTRDDGLAIDTFRVVDARGADMVGQGRWPRVRETLERAFAGRLDLESRLAEIPVQPSQNGVEIRIASSSIEVRAPDRVGLLHDLALAMTALGLEISLAKIDTRAGQATDIFEVRYSHQISEDEIRTVLRSALG